MGMVTRISWVIAGGQMGILRCSGVICYRKLNHAYCQGTLTVTTPLQDPPSIMISSTSDKTQRDYIKTVNLISSRTVTTSCFLQSGQCWSRCDVRPRVRERTAQKSGARDE